MKITNNKIQNVLQTYKNQQVNKNGLKSSRLNKKDQLNLSSEAKDFQIAMKALSSTPDIRKDKIEKIKKDIETGNYQIDSEKIVEKIIGNIKLDEMI